MAYYIQNQDTGELAANDCVGSHDRKFTHEISKAKAFDDWGKAADYSQNFGPGWFVTEAVHLKGENETR